MEFSREVVTEKVIDELLPLFEGHYLEIAHYQDIVLAPDRDFYLNAERLGLLRLFTVREFSEIMGYAVFMVNKNPHYKFSLQASQDILYLAPKVRGGMNGYRFIKWCDEQLKNEGVQVVYQHVKKKHDFGPLLERMGYRAVDTIYGRRLDLVEEF